MWTICWIEEVNGENRDCWDRFEFKSGVKIKLRELEASDKVDMNDVLVFPPDSEVNVKDVLNNFV